MSSIFDDLKTFAVKRHRAYKQKLIVILFATISIVVVGLAVAIALSKVILPLLAVTAGLIGAIWLYLKIRNIELSTLIASVKAALDKLLDLLRRKQEELSDLDKDPASFSLLELLAHANKEERNVLEEFSKIKFKDENKFENAVRKKATHDVALLIKRVYP